MRLNLHEGTPEGAPAGGETTRLQPQRPAEPTQPDIDPQTYAALVQYYQRTSEFVEPLLEDEDALKSVQRYTKDADYRRMVDDARSIYDEQRKKDSPESQMPAWAKKLNDDIEATRNLVNEKIIKPREEEQTRTREQYEAQQREAAKELMQKHGIDVPMMRAVAAYGDQLGIRDIGEAWKHFSAASKDKPATSLRSAAATPGVPGASTPDTSKPPTSRNDLARRLANNLRSVKAS